MLLPLYAGQILGGTSDDEFESAPFIKCPFADDTLSIEVDDVDYFLLVAPPGYKVTIDIGATSVGSIEDLPPWLPGDPVVGDGVTTESGRQYYELVVGDGAQPAGPTSAVNVHYTGWLVTGDKFDSSVDRGRPISFRLDGVIAGWTEGVGSMRIGGKRKLIIPFKLAYGEAGRPGTIPPRATLIFDVELLEILAQ